jgi:hypothetical protein
MSQEGHLLGDLRVERRKEIGATKESHESARNVTVSAESSSNERQRRELES